MNRSYAYILAGAALAGVAVLVLRSYADGESLAPSPSDEIARMMSQTRQKVSEIQSSFDDFRRVLNQASSLESHPSSSG